MNKKLLLLLALLLCVRLGSAQSPSSGRMGPVHNIQSTQLGTVSAQPGNEQVVGINNFTYYARRSGKEVSGSPYADSRWLMAHLQMTNNAQIAPLPLRYDVLNKRLMMQSSDAVNDSLQLNDNALISFELDEPAVNGKPAYIRFFRRFLESPDPSRKTDYVEVLHKGKITLLKHYGKIYVEAAPKNGMVESTDRIADKITYYVSRPGVAPLPVKLTLKGLQVGLPELASALKAAPGAQSAKTDTEWGAVLNSIDPTE